MSLTYCEIVERMLKYLDRDELLEILEITDEEILDRFDDRITRYYDEIMEALPNEYWWRHSRWMGQSVQTITL